MDAEAGESSLATGFAGGVVAYALEPRIQDMLFRTQARDLPTFLVVAGTLLVVAIGAAAVPGLRATRVDPNIALRAD